MDVSKPGTFFDGEGVMEPADRAHMQPGSAQGCSTALPLQHPTGVSGDFV